MTGVLDRQEVIAVLDLQEVGARGHRPEEVPSYREVVADALMALVATTPVSVQVRCTDMEDYARIHNVGFGEAVEQFGELLGDARQDLAPEASAGDLLAWLDDAAKAMGGGEHDDARLELVTDGGQGLGTCSTQLADQPLRDALIRHWDETCNGVDWLAGTPEEYASEAIRFLAAHPAEPAPVVTNEAVEAAAKAVSLDWENYTASMRTALAAAAPLLGPRPLLDRDAVGRHLGLVLARIEAQDYSTIADAGDGGPIALAEIIDAVMELARPMPTREQIAAAGHRWSCLKRDEPVHELDAIDYDRADEILEIWALLNGAVS